MARARDALRASRDLVVAAHDPISAAMTACRRVGLLAATRWAGVGVALCGSGTGAGELAHPASPASKASNASAASANRLPSPASAPTTRGRSANASLHARVIALASDPYRRSRHDSSIPASGPQRRDDRVAVGGERLVRLVVHEVDGELVHADRG